MNKQDLSGLHEQLGYIRGKVEKIDSIDDRLRNVEKKVSNMLGYASGISAFLSLIVVFLKERFFRQ